MRYAPHTMLMADASQQMRRRERLPSHVAEAATRDAPTHACASGATPHYLSPMRHFRRRAGLRDVTILF